MKRKARSESESANPSAGPAFGSDSLRQHAAKRGHISRSSSAAIEDDAFVSIASNPRGQPVVGEGPEARNTNAAGIAALGDAPGSANAPALRRAQTQPAAAARPRVVPEVPNQSAVLPAGKVFSIQIGSELFRLSGASISSDAPSYFSHFFGDQLYNSSTKPGELKTLYIDRDPETFRDISLHLQGYYVKPRDGTHFIRLFADAQFYSLPRLTQQLFKSEIFIQIGNRDFQIPRDLFSSPGDSPNFFSLGFAHFFTTPKEVFPGLDRQTLLRPPSILPPAVPNRSGDVFADLVKLLQGYPLNVRDEGHRADLLRDARYFHLKGLEQRLLPCNISYNLARQKQEMVLRLEDIRQSGISLVPTPNSPIPTTSNSPSAPPPTSPPRSGFINYARPFIDDTAHELIVEIGSESARLDISTMRAVFHGQTKARIASLFQVIASKMGLPATQPLGLMMMQTGGGVAAQPASPANSGISEERVKVSVGSDAWIVVDGVRLICCEGSEREGEKPLAPRLRTEERWGFEDCGKEWIVKRGHWRVRVQATEGYGGAEVVLQAVRLEAFTGESARNGGRGFLA